jgi:hypothetical protein
MVEAAFIPASRGRDESLLKEMNLLFFHWGMTEAGKWEHWIRRDRIDNGRNVSSFSSFRIGWGQYKPTRYREAFMRKIFACFFYLVELTEKTLGFTFEK